jgi:hypothetical protein
VAGFDPVILPGGEGKIAVTVQTDRYRGPVSKGVTIYSNDPDNARALVRVKGNILVPVEVLPRARAHFVGKVEEMKPQEFTIVARNGEPFDILKMANNSEYLDATVQPAPEEAKPRADGSKAPYRAPAAGADLGGYAAYKAVVKVVGSPPMGRFQGRITLTLNHPKEPRLDLNVTGRIDGGFAFHPQTLFFRARQGGEPMLKQEVRISRRPQGGLEILDVESTSPDFVPSVKVVAEGFEYRVVLTRPQATARKWGQGILRVRTNHGYAEIPFSAR